MIKRIKFVVAVSAIALAAQLSQPVLAACGGCSKAEGSAKQGATAVKAEGSAAAKTKACAASGKACASGHKDCASGAKACAAGAKECAKACAAGAKECAKGAKADAATLGIPALKAMMDAGTKLTLLDARSGKYDDGRRLPGARQLGADADAKAVADAIAAKDALVVTYCSSLKCKASSKLAAALRSQGYANVLELPEGLAGWEAAGYAVETPEAVVD